MNWEEFRKLNENIIVDCEEHYVNEEIKEDNPLYRIITKIGD